MKMCAGCSGVFPLDQFNSYVRTKDGKQSYCKTCQKNKRRENYVTNREDQLAKRQKWREDNREKDGVSHKRWKEKNPERYKELWQKHNKQRRMKVLQKIGGEHPKCVRCGCDRPEFLEINHRNGGGAKEVRSLPGRNQKFQSMILSGERTTEDLELLCKPCNNLHALELRYGELPYEIIWKGKP